MVSSIPIRDDPGPPQLLGPTCRREMHLRGPDHRRPGPGLFTFDHHGGHPPSTAWDLYTQIPMGRSARHLVQKHALGPGVHIFHACSLKSVEWDPHQAFSNQT